MTHWRLLVSKVEKPWGWYEILEQDEGYWIKKIFVKAHQRLSLQAHENREEYWTLLKGRATVLVGNNNMHFGYGDGKFIRPMKSVHIPYTTIHRFMAHEEDCTFIEIAIGKPDEDDIRRFEDIYGREVEKTDVV